MKIAVVCMKYDYGHKEHGYSYEYYNIFMPLVDVFGQENVIHFDFFSVFKEKGKVEMNKEMVDNIKKEKPDVTVFCLFESEFEEESVNKLKNYSKTVVYFFDDPWRQEYVRHWIKYFNFFSTSDYYMFRKYKLEGIKNVVYSPFGFNFNIYKKLNLEKKYDVSFVGNYSASREWIFKLLLKKGIKVNVFGRGWGSEKQWLKHERMVEVFNQTKINLNLSNAIYKELSFLFWASKSSKALKQLLLLKKHKEQVKGRHFEINGCGGFQLSYFVPGLNLIYEIDKEIAVFEGITNLGDEIKFFLQNDELRKQIADNGYLRSITDHKAQEYIKKLIEHVYNH